MQLRIEPLEAERFAPFGDVIEQPDAPAHAGGPGWQWWGETVLLASDTRPYGIGYLDLQPAPLQFDWAERHMRSAELLIPAGGDCLVYVGPSDHPEEPGRLPALDTFRVFQVRQGQGVLLHPGVWHGAPLAARGALNVVVLLLQDTGRSDTHVVRFEDNPVQIRPSEF